MARSMNTYRTPRGVACPWVLALLLGVTGCTICPDPFDYSGPVPNGSAPQNDFRARSGGITPLDGVPRPWPPVVQATPDSDDASRTAVTAAVEELPTAAEPGADPAAAPTSPDVEEEKPVQTVAVETADAEATPHAEELPATTAPAVDDILPPTAPPRPEILPPLRETPGWRPRG